MGELLLGAVRRVKGARSAIVGLVALLASTGASALGLSVAAEPGPGQTETVTFAVGLSEDVVIAGYELFLGWDPSELTFGHASPVWGGGFTVAPLASADQRARVARLSLTPMGLGDGSLFRVTFLVASSVTFDASADFFVTAHGGGIAPPPDVLGLLDLKVDQLAYDLGPSGIEAAPVPASAEPMRGPPEPPSGTLTEDLLAAAGRVERIAPIRSTPFWILGDAQEGVPDESGRVRHGFGRNEFSWVVSLGSAETAIAAPAIPEPDTIVYAGVVVSALLAYPALARRRQRNARN